ncbi:MAG: CRISPR-associated endonuclease Cas1 [Acidobacteria bacterium]|nr:CRISPR-associated endonuclease Cas1 [Acidobacteriota bacterium]
MSLVNSDAFEQIPARMVNEYAYCPRLFYLEYVQGEWAHSADTLDGRFVHRRVDQEKGSLPAAADLSAQVKLHSRSVLIGSDQLGAVARIDLIETDGGKAVPVDYKRGSPPDVPEGAWEPERVQLCLQGLLLRENGYECDYGELYFAASQARVTVDFTDELIARTMDLLAEARRVAVSGEIPPPLVDSPKCPRCSLVGICLPDEINLLRATTAGAPPRLTRISPRATSEARRLVAARDDRLAVYVQGQGFSVGLKGETLEIRDKGKVVDEARLLDTAQLNLFGNVQLSAQALRELASRDIVVTHLSYGGWLTAVTTPPPHKNIELRRRQFQAAGDPASCLRLAQAFVSGKIRNCRTLLRRNARELPDGVLHRLAESRRRAERAVMIEQLLGIEGAAAREYFSNFARMFKTDEDATAFEFAERNRRPPRDPVNGLLSFLYTMLVKDMVATLVGVGFDPYLGFYHQPKYGRPALALDLMEEFRPLVADSVAVGMINNGELRQSDFIARAGAVAMTDSGRRRVIEAYERRMDTLVTHPKFGYAISYRRIFEVQARLLGRFLTGEIAAYPPFCTR